MSIKPILIAGKPEYVGDVVIPINARPRRKWWYTLLDRHTTRTPIDKSLIGKQVYVRRCIVRTGYFFQPTDVDMIEIRPTVDKIMEQKLRQCFENAGKIEDQFPDVFKKAAQELETNFGWQAHKQALFEARGLWFHEAFNLEQYKSYRRLRTFWYVDIKDVDPTPIHKVTIDKIRRHWVGIQYPPETYGGSWGEDYDYMPGGLDKALYQQVYEAPFHFRNYADYHDGWLEIHPLDILKEEEIAI